MAAFVWAAAVAGNWSVGANWQVGGTPQAAPPTTSDTVTFGLGTGFTQSNCTLDTTGTCSTINFTGYTGTFTTTGQALNVSGATALFVAGMTITGSSTSAITVSGAGATFTGGGKSFPGTVLLTGSGVATVAGTNTFVNLTRTGTGVKTDALTVSTTQVVTGTLTVGGNTTQGVNRLLVNSNTRGVQRTITMTGAAVVISGDVDFQDINITGSPSWTNTGSKFVGDALGNSSLVTTNITVAATQTHTTSTGGNWSDATKWTSRVPLPQDNVIVNVNTTGALAVDMPRLGADITLTGFTGSVNLSTNTESYGSMTVAAGMTTSNNGAWTLAGRSTHTLTMAGQTWPGAIFINAPSGTYILQDSLTISRGASGALTLSNGTLTDNGQSVTLTSATNATYVQTAGTLTASGAWSIACTNAVAIWSVTGGAVNHTGSITLSGATANTRIFAGFGQIYGILNYTIAGSTGQLTITGANSFAAINFSDATNARTLILPGSATTTISAAGGFNGVAGTAGKLMSVSASAGTATLALTGGCTCSFVSLTSISATPSGAAYAFDSINVSGNSGWIFSPPDELPDAIDAHHKSRTLARVNASSRAASF